MAAHRATKKKPSKPKTSDLNETAAKLPTSDVGALVVIHATAKDSALRLTNQFRAAASKPAAATTARSRTLKILGGGGGSLF